jgi:hypothetical protein
MTIGREDEGPPPNQEWRWLVIRPKARAMRASSAGSAFPQVTGD